MQRNFEPMRKQVKALAISSASRSLQGTATVQAAGRLRKGRSGLGFRGGNREACVLLSVCEAQTRCSSRDFTSWAKSNGVAVVGSSPAGLLDYKALRCRWPAALLIRSEKRGLSEHLVETADFMVRIPMRGGCDSINVSVAAGVLLFEMSNQRRGSLRAIPQGIQADELPTTAHFCLFAETRSSTSFVRALCMLTVSSMRGTMARISQNSRSLTTERGALASFWKRSARPGAGILCASQMSGAEQADTAEDSPILPIH